mmetsp:Transcript_7001/g.20298  ORF Transcript_7001/g.20298 Transcript_7001/m.20298 type:complete len:1066 (+) Transcript_7001:843-4040(+)
MPGWFLALSVLLLVRTAAGSPGDDLKAGWFTSTGESLDGSSLSLSFPPPGFSSETYQQQQQLAALQPCVFDEPLLWAEGGVSNSLEKPLVVDACSLDCKFGTLQSTVRDAPIVAVRNGGSVTNCKVALVKEKDLFEEDLTLGGDATIPPTSLFTYYATAAQTGGTTAWGTYYDQVKHHDPTTACGFLCDQGDCFLGQVSCTAIPTDGDLNLPMMRECVLVRPGAGTVRITRSPQPEAKSKSESESNNNDIVPPPNAQMSMAPLVGKTGDVRRIVSAYGIVVDAGPNPEKESSSETATKHPDFRYYTPGNDEDLTKTRLLVDGVRIENQAYDGIKIVGGANTVRITDSDVTYNGKDGIEVQEGQGLKVLAVMGGSLSDNGRNGIHVAANRPYSDETSDGSTSGVGWDPLEILIADADVGSNGEDGVLVMGNRVKEVVLDGVKVQDNALDGIDVWNAGAVRLQGVVSKHNAQNGLAVEAIGAEVEIANSVFVGNGGDLQNSDGPWKNAGIYMWLSKSATITNSVSNGNGMDGIRIYDVADISLEGVDVIHNGDDGIQIREARAAYGYDYTAHTDFLIGVYYYPWHGDNFHNGGGYLRNQLDPPQQPALGEYNDSDPEIITQHLEWFRRSNIGLLVTSWWGPNRIEDTNTKNVLLQHEHIGNLKIALHYETTGRITLDDEDMSVPRSDIQYLCANYFDHPNYYKIDGRPVLVIYISRKLEQLGTLEKALLVMKSEANKCGHNLYLIGDAVFAKAPDKNSDEPVVSFVYFDAVTNYDVYGSSGASKRSSPYATAQDVDAYYEEQSKWRELALKENCRFIPPVSPGYNDLGVRPEKDHPPLSRRLENEASEEGSLFRYQLEKALPLVDPIVDNLILVNSFNEWHEDTQIEPVIAGDNGLATQPEALTNGLEYVAYGELYLDILRSMTERTAGNQKTNLDDALIYEPSQVALADVHSCRNGNDGISFFITNNNRDAENQGGELDLIPGPDIFSCSNDRFDYRLYGGGAIDYHVTASSQESTSTLTGTTCGNGFIAFGGCPGLELQKCSSKACRKRVIRTRSGTELKDHLIK